MPSWTSAARKKGSKAEHVDLARFVADAILLDGGEVLGSLEAEHFAVKIPSAWVYGLNNWPGYDADDRLVRLTTRWEVTSDDAGHAIGFLGRAHPLVRRALDCVRNLSFGGAASRGQDPRVSAIRAKFSESTLLFTCLGRVASRQGRELERVRAVQIGHSGATTLYASADDWSQWLDPSKAIRTTDLWTRHFESWSGSGGELAREQAKRGFNSFAQEFVAERQQT